MRDAGTKPVADGRAPVHEVASVPVERSRGRHRKPRPRRVLVAVGGLALAAGALSLMRLAPEPPGGADGGGGGVTATDIETADIEPTAVGATEAPRPVSDTRSAVAEGTPAPRNSPSATKPPSGGNERERASDPAVTPTATPPTPSRTAASGQPTAAPEAAKPPAPEKPSNPTPQPTSPAPHPDRPQLCVPIVSLCLDAPG
ncbi:hypothetical protein [Streptomyces flaveus]|uniref:hypothetical protein n=1 Tax=Streptomyces flaveus TaxID=66370 RepID=UPI003316B663